MSPSPIPQKDANSLPLSNWTTYTRPKIVQQALRLMEKTIRDTPPVSYTHLTLPTNREV